MSTITRERDTMRAGLPMGMREHTLEIGHERWETSDGTQEMGDRRCEMREHKLETGHERWETSDGDLRWEVGGERVETEPAQRTPSTRTHPLDVHALVEVVDFVAVGRTRGVEVTRRILGSCDTTKKTRPAVTHHKKNTSSCDGTI